MKKLLNTGRKKGASPGSLIYTGDKGEKKASVNIFSYNADSCSLSGSAELSSVPERDKGKNRWIQIEGVNDIEFIEKLGQTFAIHPLSLEDVLNVHHRPKIEENEGYLFTLLKSLKYEENDIHPSQISIILTDKTVITFQENETVQFNVLKTNLQQNKGRIRKLGADYLAYRVIDSIVDDYFGVLEQVGTEIEEIEDEVIAGPTNDTLKRLHALKNNLIMIRRYVWPLREVVGSLEKMESELINASTLPFLRDLYDHIIQIIDTTENYREMVSGMIDIYLSSISNRMNEVMKVLTIISTIFIPITFIAGVYGMNFEIPELKYRYGYPVVLCVMLVITVGLLIFFKKKKWF